MRPLIQLWISGFFNARRQNGYVKIFLEAFRMKKRKKLEDESMEKFVLYIQQSIMENYSAAKPVSLDRIQEKLEALYPYEHNSIAYAIDYMKDEIVG